MRGNQCRHPRVGQGVMYGWLFAFIPLVVGGGFLSAGVYGLRRTAALRRAGVTARGRIVGHDMRRDEEGGKSHHLVVAWTDRDGRECRHSSVLGRSTVLPGFSVGSAVTVVYDANKPRRFEVKGWDTSTIWVVFTVVGSVLTAGTLLLGPVLFLTL
ncbi:DUF3592 domain-containing protein [Streptomyces sp. NPDC006704]|uniref:DUF3592 domain-containing protein n=1 Tax=Streptomyces sp. NPDC006704 TaxID=3364760 RepID=UPI003676C954